MQKNYTQGKLELFAEFDDDKRTLDDLFHRSIRFQTSEKFLKYLAFVQKFKEYSIFNNTLVYLQNPEVSYYATARHWKNAFDRTVKPDARPLVILAPMSPVLFVYDLYDTTGPEMPAMLEEPITTEGKLDTHIFATTLINCHSMAIKPLTKKMSRLKAGFVANIQLLDSDYSYDSYKYIIVFNSDSTLKQRYSTLCHELAHLFLGHLGPDIDDWWLSREKLPQLTKEIEAEAVSYLVCNRCGLISNSEEYIGGYISDVRDLRQVSIELISKVASQIERMGKERIPPRKRKSLK